MITVLILIRGLWGGFAFTSVDFREYYQRGIGSTALKGPCLAGEPVCFSTHSCLPALGNASGCTPLPIPFFLLLLFSGFLSFLRGRRILEEYPTITSEAEVQFKIANSLFSHLLVYFPICNILVEIVKSHLMQPITRSPYQKAFPVVNRANFNVKYHLNLICQSFFFTPFCLPCSYIKN